MFHDARRDKKIIKCVLCDEKRKEKKNREKLVVSNEVFGLSKYKNYENILYMLACKCQ